MLAKKQTNSFSVKFFGNFPGKRMLAKKQTNSFSVKFFGNFPGKRMLAKKQTNSFKVLKTRNLMSRKKTEIVDISELERTFLAAENLREVARNKIIEYYKSQGAKPGECDHPLTRSGPPMLPQYRICECCGYDRVGVDDPDYRRLERVI